MSGVRDGHKALLAYRKSASEIASDVEYLRSVLRYDPATGGFIWMARSGARGVDRTGSNAGSVTAHGRVEIGVKGQRFFAHELAWVMTHGCLPTGDIDHINGDPSDNRLENLRDVCRTVNMQNLKGPTKRSTTGYLGVSRRRDGATAKPYRAQIVVAGKTKNLGNFDCPKEAYQAYLQAKRLHHTGNTL